MIIDDLFAELLLRPWCLFCKHQWKPKGWTWKECQKCKTFRTDIKRRDYYDKLFDLWS